ncbi:MAG: GPR endopeptidase [Clostridia bacterium]|nr:GPR endopeptidase [Clostridia bacterium]
MYNIRTDLAIETREMYRAAKKLDDEIPGVETNIDNSEKDILITKVKITSDVAAEMLNKAKGEYITIEAPKLKNNDEEFNNKISERLATIIKEITNLKAEETVLVVGLGNWDITADALGPKVVSRIDLTRHLIEYVPQYVKEGTRPICAISPGVLGTTGIETGEIIKGIVEKISPDILIVIDALASRKMERINTTIQISNTGIVPGSGVGNARNAITQETMGIPVIAIGVPTVVEAAVIANDALELLINKMQMEEGTSEALQKLSGEDNYQEIKSALLPKDYNFIVTPKEIDELIENMSNVIAEGINQAL